MRNRIFVLVVVIFALLAMYGCGGSNEESNEKIINRIHASFVDNPRIYVAAYIHMQIPDTINNNKYPVKFGWCRAIVISKMHYLGTKDLYIKFFLDDSSILEYRSAFDAEYFNSLLQVGSEVRLLPNYGEILDKNTTRLIRPRVPVICDDDITTDTTYYR